MTDEPQPATPTPGPGAQPPPPPTGSWPPPPPQQPPPQQPAPWQAPPPEPGPAPGVNFAPHGTRFIAYVLDGCIVSAVLIVLLVAASLVVALVAATGSQTATAIAASILVIGVLVLFVLSIAYFPYFWVKNGQTPGMRPFNLYVVRDDNGGPITWGPAIIRLIGLWVGAVVFYLGFIWVFIDARRRGWHDLMAGTCVIERRQ